VHFTLVTQALKLYNVHVLDMSQFTVEGAEMIEKEAKPSGNTAHVYVPKDWRGSTLKIIRVDEPDQVEGQSE
jgi:putative transposon-encoded protein